MAQKEGCRWPAFILGPFLGRPMMPTWRFLSDQMHIAALTLGVPLTEPAIGRSERLDLSLTIERAPLAESASPTRRQ